MTTPNEQPEFNIVEMIEKNPIAKLDNNYNGKLLTKIKATFNGFEQQLFVSSFYCYLNYNKTDFVIDLDDVWKWLGFSTKQKAKMLLEKHFILNTDYIISRNLQVKQSLHIKGGQNKETFMLTVKTFKLFCIKAGTKKADEIHDYYVKLEEILQDVIEEESNELKLQLDQQKHIVEEQHKQIENQVVQTQKEKEQLLEKTLLSQFPINTECIYYGCIDNKSLGKAPRLHNEDLIKFGQSNNLAERIKCHKKNFTNFRLVAAFKVKNKIQIENAIKKHPILTKRMRSIKVENANYEEENYRELLALDNENFTIEKIDEYIKDVIKENEYNIENYNLLVEKNYSLEETVRKLERENKLKDEQIGKLTIELEKYTSDITTYTKDKIASNYAICKYGYYLYAFEYEPMRYKCSITRHKDFDQVTTGLKQLDKDGDIKYHTTVKYAFSEKIMMFLLKQSLSSRGNNKFEGSFEMVKQILDITSKLEGVLIDNGNDLNKISDLLDGKFIPVENIIVNPEIPQVRKVQHAVDQVHPDTNEVIKTYPSFEAAGRAIGLTTGTAIGNAARNTMGGGSGLCKGFLWRYAGISKEDQFSEQPVVKVCCSTGEKKRFNTIADAAKDCSLSPPGMRTRILTSVHADGYHWTFDKSATHYNQL
jgi:hypothetical protein